MENSKKKWSKWVVTSDWEVGNPEMVDRCAESNRLTWVPQQKIGMEQQMAQEH
jgi:hypothetical protein